MNLDEIPDNAKVLIDTNIFVYHFSGISQDCRSLLMTCSKGRIAGYTSSVILAELLHRLMVAEAISKELGLRENAIKQLRKQPEIVKELIDYRTDVYSIREMGIEVLPHTLKDIEFSYQIRKEYGLLTNDSLIIASMKEVGISILATNDRDFDRISNIKVFKPSDV